MEIVSFPTPGLGDQTHLFVHDGVGILVDPQRDIGRFLAAARERDVQIRWVLETHLHNDYVSGAEQAALAADAELVLPAAAAAAYRHTPAFHLEDLPTHAGIGIRPIHTPGHTPEHTSYLVSIHRAPVGVFTGGSLLTGSAGRPDLLGPERAETLARLQHRSIHRLAELPGQVALYPTHGAGSFCTTSGSGPARSTIADQVRDNPLLALPDADALAQRLLTDPMPIPSFYARMAPVNVLGVPPMPAHPAPTVPLGTTPAGQLVDLRPREQQAKGFVPGSLTIEHGTDFGSWAGWLVPAGEPIVLVADAHQGEQVDDAVTQLARIGVDSVVGVVTDVTSAPEHHEFRLVDVGAPARCWPATPRCSTCACRTSGPATGCPAPSSASCPTSSPAGSRRPSTRAGRPWSPVPPAAGRPSPPATWPATATTLASSPAPGCRSWSPDQLRTSTW